MASMLNDDEASADHVPLLHLTNNGGHDAFDDRSHPRRSKSSLGRGRRLFRLPSLNWKTILGGIVVTFAMLYWSAKSYHPETAAERHTRLDRWARVRMLNEMLDNYYPPIYPQGGRIFNRPPMDRLMDCLEHNTCNPSELNIVILGSGHFANSLLGSVSGEDIWALSSIEVMTALNYTLLHVYGHMEILAIYQHLPDMVKIVIWEPASLTSCFARNNETWQDVDNGAASEWQRGTKGCMKTREFPEGIPLHKSFALHFWLGPATPLGKQWTLSPEDYKQFTHDEGNYYIGYQLEAHCGKQKVYTPAERNHNSLVLAKNPFIFAYTTSAWYHMLKPVADSIEPAYDRTAGRVVPFEFISTAGDPGVEIDEPGVNSMGRLPRDEWLEVLARSKMMLGLGGPQHSPSPYGALCVGVPFLNVILDWDRTDPWNKTHWVAQQGGLTLFDPPYVYNVHKGDEEGLRKAVHAAVDHPIGRFIPPRMTFESVKERHKQLVETDHLPAARAYVDLNYGGPENFEWLLLD